MTPRPWYRSRLFWLGLPGLVFLLWAWVTFSGTSVAVARWRKTHAYAGSGQVVLLQVHRASAGSGSASSFEARIDKRPELERRWFRQAVDWRSPLRLRSLMSTFGVALWFIVLIYVALWSGLAFWWQRRKARLLKLHTAP